MAVLCIKPTGLPPDSWDFKPFMFIYNVCFLFVCIGPESKSPTGEWSIKIIIIIIVIVIVIIIVALNLLLAKNIEYLQLKYKAELVTIK